jgi:hypothetical protein
MYDAKYIGLDVLIFCELPIGRLPRQVRCWPSCALSDTGVLYATESKSLSANSGRYCDSESGNAECRRIEMIQPIDSVPFVLKEGERTVTRDQILQAMAEFDRKGLREEIGDNRRGWFVEENGNRYEPKWIMRLATLAPERMRRRYINRDVSVYFKRGNQSPISYVKIR